MVFCKALNPPRAINPRRYINRALVQRGAREERARRMAQIAQTPWGQQWLRSLRRVDEANRLGRGMELARQRAVEGLRVDDAGEVSAEVRGSRPSPYRVRLSLKPFTPAQTAALVAEIARRPDWLDLLLNGQLPAGLSEALRQARVQLFPEWATLAMRCTCPDRVVPCEHQAAVLYQLAADIDEDPTLLFSLRGLDLARELRRVSQTDGLAPTALRMLQAPAVGERGDDEDLNDAYVPGAGDRPASASESPPGPPDAAGPSLLSQWAFLLPARPPFFRAGNLAELYLAYLRTAAAFWATSDADDGDDEATAEDAHAIPAYGLPEVPGYRLRDIRIDLDAGGGFAQAYLLDAGGARVHAFGKEVALLSFLERLERTPADPSPVAESVVALAFRLARRLVVRGAVVPRVLALGHDDYRVRWEPATQDPAVAEAVRRLGAHPDLAHVLRYRHAPVDVESDEAYRRRLGREVAESLGGPATDPSPSPAPTFRSPTLPDAPAALLGTLLRPMLLAGVQAVLAQADHAAVRLLFLGRPVHLAGEGDTQLALALPLWLRRLRLDTSSHRLLLQVDELPGAPGRYALRPLLVLEAADAPEPIPLPAVVGGALGELLRLQVLRDVALLAEGYAPLRAFVEDAGAVPDYIELYGADFARFLSEVAPALRLVGAQVLLPHGLERAARPRLSAVVVEASGEGPAAAVAKTQDGKEARRKGLLGLNSLVSFDWRVSVGDALVDADEFAELTARYEGIVRLRDGFVWLEPLQTQRLLQRLAHPPQPTAAVVVQSLLLGGFQGAPLFLSEEVRRLRESLTSAPRPGAVDLPGLQATLRPYQEVGFRWLLRNSEAGLGSLLADDMGLGKTLQTIALLEHYRARGRWDDAPALIVLPTSLITNWQRELARFAPELRVGVYHGGGRKRGVLARPEDRAGSAHVILTSYGIVRSDVEELAGRDWGAVVIDEAQQIKNPGAGQTKAVKRLGAPITIALSGTPVENRLSEYWSVLDFANPGYLGPLAQFKAVYADPIERDRDPGALERFRQVTAPFLLRRLKTDRSVISDLPDKITQVEPVSLEPEQAALYQQVVETQLRELAAADETMRRARMLKFMTAVKQVCNHPHHYLKRGSRDVGASGKSQRLLELVEAALANRERVLVFTQYRQMGELLAEMLRGRLGYGVPFLHGGLQREERDAMVAGMQDGSGAPVLLLSIKAGGTGLNLTAANHVIHYDLWWNPAVESQATDRAFRIGQRRHVHVHRLITAGTFEERIDEMLSQKRELADLTVGGGGAWLGDLAEEVLAGAGMG